MSRVEESRSRFTDRLFRPVDIASLALFRVAFGLLMVHHVWVEYSGYGGFQLWFVEPAFHFTYYGFGWVKPLPEAALHLVYLAQGLACIGITLGLAYRFSATINFLATTYFFLLEKTLFINHGYLLCLISFLLIFLPLHHAWSLDARLRPGLRTEVAPFWVLLLLRIQIGIVYFYGGLAKINPDWLRGEPMRTYLADWAGRPFVGVLADAEPAVWFFTAGGLLLDLFVVPALLWRPTRIPAFLAAAAFHLTNAWLFYIAIFPWFMLAATTLFFPPDWPRRVWGIVTRKPQEPIPTSKDQSSSHRGLVLGALAIWITIQALVPFRHFLYPGDASWTEEGHHFAWRMMLRHKAVQPRFVWYTVIDTASDQVRHIDPFQYLPAEQAAALAANPTAMQAFAAQIAQANREQGVEVEVQAELRLIQFTITDPGTGESWHEDINAILQPWQIEIMALDPDLILQFAHYISAREFVDSGRSVEVRAESWASLHGRPYQPLIDPAANLASMPRDLWAKPWIRSLEVTRKRSLVSDT